MLDICKARGARTVTKGKSMISEEIGLNQAIEAAGLVPIETDLGEYIVQIRGETPSHIIAPAVHLTREQVEADFRRTHDHLSADRDLSEPAYLLTEARGILRERFLAADVGITGANFLVAETGTSIIVTNEGNGDLTQILPEGAHRDRVDRKARADPRGCEPVAPRAGPLGHRAGDVGLHHSFDWAAPAGRSGRPGRIPRRAARQWPLGHAGHRVRGDAALHPVRRLHEPLPDLPFDRRPRLWLDLSGPDGRGADARA